MHTSKYTTKRIPKNETANIFELQKAVSDNEKHLKWLKKATEDIQNQSRVGFGVYYRPSEPGADPKERIVGSVIVKMNEYSSIIEIKNIFIYEANLRRLKQAPHDVLIVTTDDDYDRECNQIRLDLIKKVERFCQKRGFYTIEIELNDSDEPKISVFRSKGYQVLATLPSKASSNNKDNYVYFLRKELQPSYIGDPYDYDMVAEWYLETIWGFSNLKSEEVTPLNGQIQFSRFSFLFIPNSVKTRTISLQPMKGICAITEDDVYSKKLNDAQLTKIYGGDFSIKLLIAAHPQPQTSKVDKLKAVCEHKGIHLITREELFSTLGELFRQNTTLKKEDIRGLLLEVDAEFKLVAQQCRTNFIYPMLNGIGSSLTTLLPHKSEDEDFYLFYYSDENTGTEGGIWGYSKIKAAYYTSFEEFEYLIGTNLEDSYLFKKEEFLYYATYYNIQNKNRFPNSRNIVCLYLEQPKMTQTPVDIGDAASKLIEEIVQDNKSNANLNNLYLDNNTVENILEFAIFERIN